MLQSLQAGWLLISLPTLVLGSAAIVKQIPVTAVHFGVGDYEPDPKIPNVLATHLIVCSDRPDYYIGLINEFSTYAKKPVEVQDGLSATMPSASRIAFAFLGNPYNSRAAECLQRYPRLKAIVDRETKANEASGGHGRLPLEVRMNAPLPLGKTICQNNYDTDDAGGPIFVGLAYSPKTDCATLMIPGLFGYTMAAGATEP